MVEAFERIYEEYFPRVYAFLYRMCGSEDLAEELTQETFFQAFRTFHKFRGDCELFTWLAAIAKHTFSAYIRKNKKESDYMNTDALVDSVIGSGEGDPEDIIQRGEMGKAVRQAVEKLPDKYRDVVLLRIYAEMSFAEIGESLKISEGSAKVLFLRAKKLILEELKNEHFL